MKILTYNEVTKFSKSPVISIQAQKNLFSGHYLVRLALTEDGNIYRILNSDEKPITVEPRTIAISPLTAELIEEAQVTQWENTRLYRRSIVQKYNVQLEYIKIHNCPLFELNEQLYYPALTALEKEAEIREARKQLDALNEKRKELTAQIEMLKAEAAAAEYVKEGYNKRQAVALALAGKSYRDTLRRLFEDKKIHPNGYTGTGKYASKSADHAAKISTILEKSGIKHKRGNDAPRGGWAGEFITIK